MIQHLLKFENGPSELSPGTPVHWYFVRRGHWRTGEFVRIIKRGRRRGKAKILSTSQVPNKWVYVSMDHIKPIVPAL